MYVDIAEIDRDGRLNYLKNDQWIRGKCCRMERNCTEDCVLFDGVRQSTLLANAEYSYIITLCETEIYAREFNRIGDEL